MKWDKETGLPVPGTCRSKNRRLERLFADAVLGLARISNRFSYRKQAF